MSASTPMCAQKTTLFHDVSGFEGKTTQLIGIGSVKEPQRRMDGQGNLKLVKKVLSFLKEKESL
jgi:hypothetical protein